MTAENGNNLTRKDFLSPQEVRWCAGCGDFAILNAMQRVFPELGIPREKFVVVSGIGCSSRLPYYMNSYGYHTIHGRAPTVATGIKVANPDLSVWVVTGDGDGLSIGGNHFLHVLRRNPDLNIILFNNEIYGLTKGQYSPTSKMGLKTKTSPLGSPEPAMHPLRVAMASEATFVARTVDTNLKHMAAVFKAAADHKGASFVEVMQNCVTFNDGTFEDITSRENRDDQLIYLEHGQPLIFGKNSERGIRLNKLGLEVVTLGEGGVKEEDILLHNAHSDEPGYAYLLTQLVHPHYPTPVGIFRSTKNRYSYETVVEAQIKDAVEKTGKPDLTTLLKGKDFWEVPAEEPAV